jgi:hypothetical protein
MARIPASRTPLIIPWLCGVLLVLCTQALGQTQIAQTQVAQTQVAPAQVTPAQATAPKPAAGASTSPLGKTDYPFNSRWTTRYGPAYADILLVPSKGASSPNMLNCKPSTNQNFAYALCYYSGPSVPTGNSGNPALPCELSLDKKSATCVCYKITNADYAKDYQVDINAILNLDVYKQTVAACQHDGSTCSSTGSTVTPPVCNAINDATIPTPPTIVSVFSMAMNSAYSSSPAPGSTACRAGLYAGCMTAACTDLDGTRNGHAVVRCHCPVFNGPYQVGEANAQCNANLVAKSQGGTTKGAGPFYVWSAARTVIVNTTPSAKTASKP